MSEIIAKAMNSTLGTNKFKAFDELMAYRGAVASDELITTIDQARGEKVSILGNYNGTGNKDITSVSRDIISFRVKVKGTVKITLGVEVCDNSKIADRCATGVVSLFKNNEQIATGSYRSDGGTLSSGESPVKHDVVWYDVPIDTEDIFTIRLAVSTDFPSTADLTGYVAITSAIMIKGTLHDYIKVELI